MLSSNSSAFSGGLSWRLLIASKAEESPAHILYTASIFLFLLLLSHLPVWAAHVHL